MKNNIIFGCLFLILFILVGCKSNIKKEDKITVILKNSDEEILDEFEVTKDQEVNLPIINQDGYAFVGWFEDLLNQDSYVELVTSFNDDIILYGKWEIATVGLEFDLIDDEYVVIGYIGNDQNVTIPQYYQGKLVTRIGQKAFFENQIITNVILPDSIIVIEEEAFMNSENLEMINFPNSLESIETSAFQFCTNLIITKIDAIHIGSSAFDTCSKIKNLTLSERVQTIGAWAFYSNAKLETITLHENIEKIEKHAFSWCHNFTIYSPTTNLNNLNSILKDVELIYCQYEIKELT